MRFGLHAKILVAFLLLSLVPLCLSAAFIFLNGKRMEANIVTHISESYDAEMRRRLERRATEVAASVRGLLLQCEGDLQSLALVPRSESAYVQFARSHRSEVWERLGSGAAAAETTLFIPLYAELAFVGPDGQEQLRVVGGSASRALRDVSRPARTTYKTETYFLEARRLSPGEIYVSRLTGWHVGKRAQLGTALRSEEAAGGKAYEGVVRFAMPVAGEPGKGGGVIVLSLDHRHLMEFSQHINPVGDTPVVFPSYDRGNYAFLFDDEGWIITHPKYWDIRGLDENGALVPAYSEESSAADIERGRIPFNLFKAGFIHENYPKVASEVLQKKTGSVLAVNVGKTAKVMAYAPILFDHGAYRAAKVFGGVTIGAELTAFHRPAAAVAESIDRIVSISINSIYILIGFAGAAALIVSFSFSNRLTRPLNGLIRNVRAFTDGKPYHRVEYRSDDEIGELARSVNRLAFLLDEKEVKLEASFSQLELHAVELEHRLHLLEQIQRIGDLLGTTFDLHRILRLILESCVEGMGFDRAVLFMQGKEPNALEYRESCGFTAEQVSLLQASPYHLQQDDCVETRVMRDHRMIYIEDIRSYPGATPLDFILRERFGSRAFAYAPLMVRESAIGILGVGRHKSDAPISPIELHSLQILTNHAARVIEMSRLYGEISEDRASLEGILQSMLAGILALDTQGGIKSMNAAAERLLGIERDKTLGRPFTDAFAADPDAVRVMQDVLDWGDQYGKFELKFRAGAEEKIFYVSSSNIYTSSREHIGFILVIQDITEKRHFDEHVARMERLAGLGRLAAGVAHEIRNPLTGLSLLLDDLHDRATTDSATQTQIQGAMSALERIEQLVTQLLAHVSPHKEIIEEVDLNAVVVSTLALVKNQMKKAGIEPLTQLDTEIAPFAGDRHRLSQALLNIVLNAIQAMPAGGLLTVSTREVHAGSIVHETDGVAGSSSVIVAVSDTGSGVPRELEQRIFEPFFTTKNEGTGLGLYVTHQIVVDHGGEIFVFPGEKSGSTFSVFLPRVRQSREHR